MTPLDLVRLTGLMKRTKGSPALTIGLIDGPVVAQHPDLADEHRRETPGRTPGVCTRASSAACLHGTFVAGILCAKRGSIAPAICPDCTLLARPIFAEGPSAAGEMPSATPDELAQAILDCLDGGARLLNVSAAIGQSAIKSERALDEALGRAAARGAIVIVAAGNQGSLGSTALTRHPWVVPVVACDLRGRLMDHSNLGSSIGRRGLGAPGDRITSLGPSGGSLTMTGTSAAAPFVTGAAALLWSEFPKASSTDIKLALTRRGPGRRNSVVPPLLDAWMSYQSLAGMQARRRSA